MKVGDEVAVINWHGHVCNISKIERETKLYWIVDDQKYSKVNLSAVPSGYYSRSIVPARPEYVSAYRKDKMCQKLSYTIWSKYDLETLEKVFAIIGGLEETKGK